MQSSSNRLFHVGILVNVTFVFDGTGKDEDEVLAVAPACRPVRGGLNSLPRQISVQYSPKSAHTVRFLYTLTLVFRDKIYIYRLLISRAIYSIKTFRPLTEKRSV